MVRYEIVQTPGGFRSPDGEMHVAVQDCALHISGGRKYNISPKKPVKVIHGSDTGDTHGAEDAKDAETNGANPVGLMPDDTVNNDAQDAQDAQELTDAVKLETMERLLQEERCAFEEREKEFERALVDAEWERIGNERDFLQREREQLVQEQNANVTQSGTAANDFVPPVICRAGLALGHPVADSLTDFAAIFVMEKKLRVDKLSFGAHTALLKHLITKCPELAVALEAGGGGFSLGYGVIQFQDLLDALIEPHNITQNVLTILALANTSPELRTKVKTALEVVIKMAYERYRWGATVRFVGV